MNELIGHLWEFQPQVVVIVIVTIIIVIGAITYKVKLHKYKCNHAPKGYVLCVELFVKWIEDTIVDIMGPKLRWFTPYAIYLLLYIGLGCLLSLLGLSPLITSYTIALSLGLVTWFGIFIAGIAFQKIFFFKKFITNPLELLTQFAPLISISFRIFGNITAGGTILALFYGFTSMIWAKVPYIGSVNILGGLLAPPLHLYFDMFDGLIQTYIFALLTVSYIGMECHEPVRKEKAKHLKRKMTTQYMAKNIINEKVDIVR